MLALPAPFRRVSQFEMRLHAQAFLLLPQRKRRRRRVLFRERGRDRRLKRHGIRRAKFVNRDAELLAGRLNLHERAAALIKHAKPVAISRGRRIDIIKRQSVKLELVGQA